VSKTMSDGTRGNGDREARTDEAALSARLQRLGEGLGQLRKSAAPEPSDSAGGDRAATAAGYAKGFRLSSELVGGVLVGAALGWAIDRVLGIAPWGFIIFLLLGFVAGVLNVMRSAGVVPNRSADGAAGKPKK
jgi:ATP synthase protein I